MTKKRNDHVMQPILDALKPLELLSEPRTSGHTKVVLLKPSQLSTIQLVIEDWKNGMSRDTQVAKLYPEVDEVIKEIETILKEA